MTQENILIRNRHLSVQALTTLHEPARNPPSTHRPAGLDRLGHAPVRPDLVRARAGPGRARWPQRRLARQPTYLGHVYHRVASFLSPWLEPGLCSIAERIARQATVQGRSTDLFPRVDYDVVGAGFGPANAAFAVLLADARSEHGSTLSAHFFEKQRRPTWHPGILLPGTTTQDTFLEDLATPRNPRSRFTFLNYLHQKGRLYAFLRRQSLRISRHEFSDYLGWAADELGNVSFSHTVLGVTPMTRAGERIDALAVKLHDAATDQYREVCTRNLVVAVGAQPHIPAGVPFPAPGIFHSSQFMPDFREAHADTAAPLRILVVGSGQSAAEIVYHLLDTYPSARITWAYRRMIPHAMDDSPFSWELYQGELTANFLDSLPRTARQEFLDEYQNTNYSCINTELLHMLHELWYQEAVRGLRRLQRIPHVDLRGLEMRASELEAVLRDHFTGQTTTARFDTAVLATGYRRGLPSIIEGLSPYFLRDPDGNLEISRAYQLLTRPALRARVFVQGISEERFGIRDVLSFDVAARVTPIFDRLLTAAAED
jgi:L-ornithine N5-oxygenase